jgi:hypothetical protein
MASRNSDKTDDRSRRSTYACTNTPCTRWAGAQPLAGVERTRDRDVCIARYYSLVYQLSLSNVRMITHHCVSGGPGRHGHVPAAGVGVVKRLEKRQGPGTDASPSGPLPFMHAYIRIRAIARAAGSERGPPCFRGWMFSPPMADSRRLHSRITSSNSRAIHAWYVVDQAPAERTEPRGS